MTLHRQNPPKQRAALAKQRTKQATPARSALGNLANEVRPKTLAELLGQDDIKRKVSNWQKTGSWPRTILCTGPTGHGKTTLAYILTRLVNDLEELEEINAGDETGVDRIRSLIDLAKHRTLSGKPRVILIDEAHALSAAAYKALLAPTERGSNSTIWILTTNVPAAVKPELLRRCYRLDLKPVDEDLLAGFLSKVAAQLDVDLPEALADAFARAAHGSASAAVTALETWYDLGCPETLSDADAQAVLSSGVEDTQTTLAYKTLAGLLTSDHPTFMQGLLAQRSLASFLYVSRQVLKGYVEERALAACGSKPHGLYYGFKKGMPAKAKVDKWLCLDALRVLLSLEAKTQPTPEDVYCALLPLLGRTSSAGRMPESAQ